MKELNNNVPKTFVFGKKNNKADVISPKAITTRQLAKPIPFSCPG